MPLPLPLLLACLLALPSAALADEGEDAEDEAGEEHAPPPVPAPAEEEQPAEEAPAEEEQPAEEAPAEEAPAAAPPEPAGWTPERGRAERDAQAYDGLYVVGATMGGMAFGGGVRGVLPQTPLTLEALLGLRIGLGGELYGNPVGTVGASVLAGRRARVGPFVRAGSTLPLPEWHQAFVAGGLETRFLAGNRTWLGLDGGFGWMIVQELPEPTTAWPGILYLRFSVEIAAGG